MFHSLIFTHSTTLSLNDRITLKYPGGELVLILKDAIDLYPNEVRRILKFETSDLDKEAGERLQRILKSGIHDIIPYDKLNQEQSTMISLSKDNGGYYTAISPLRLL